MGFGKFEEENIDVVPPGMVAVSPKFNSKNYRFGYSVKCAGTLLDQSDYPIVLVPDSQKVIVQKGLSTEEFSLITNDRGLAREKPVSLKDGVLVDTELERFRSMQLDRQAFDPFEK